MNQRFLAMTNESEVPWLLTGKVVHSERLTDRSTDLYGTVVIANDTVRKLSSEMEA